MTADEVVELLGLRAHPEGGHYAETWRDTPADGSRGAGSAIYFLLRHGERSEWHRVDAAETWHFYAGAPLELLVGGDGERPPVDGRVAQTHILGADLEADERPQSTVPAHAWQSARSLGDWTLVGCTVSPAFSFDGFELWQPSAAPGLSLDEHQHDGTDEEDHECGR